MKIITIVGARPQFIKAIALSIAVGKREGIEEVLLHTGQHYDQNMSEVFFRDLGLPKPAYMLDIGGGSHAEMTGRQLIEIEKILAIEQPDLCLVYGDTNSTLAGSIAAAKLHIPVAHVEAGLRSFNRRMPEEINRIVADHISTWLFTPTKYADENLLKEGLHSTSIFRVGDVMYDVSNLFSQNRSLKTDIISTLGITPKSYVVSTVHRQENTDEPGRLTAILAALEAFSQRMPVVLPLHPRTAKAVAAEPQAVAHLKSLHVVDPLGFFDMATLLSEAALTVTDSGGLQKESYFNRVPCVAVREETEWVELVELGWNRLPGGLTKDGIVAAMEAALGSAGRTDCMPYGNGDAADRILDALQGEWK